MMQKDIYLSFHKTMGNKPVPFMCACVLWQILLGQSQRKKKTKPKITCAENRNIIYLYLIDCISMFVSLFASLSQQTDEVSSPRHPIQYIITSRVEHEN